MIFVLFPAHVTCAILKGKSVDKISCWSEAIKENTVGRQWQIGYFLCIVIFLVMYATKQQSLSLIYPHLNNENKKTLLLYFIITKNTFLPNKKHQPPSGTEWTYIWWNFNSFFSFFFLITNVLMCVRSGTILSVYKSVNCIYFYVCSEHGTTATLKGDMLQFLDLAALAIL